MRDVSVVVPNWNGQELLEEFLPSIITAAYRNHDILPTRLPNQPEPFDSFFACSGYAAYDAAKFGALGGFSELLAPMYWDDVEICYRAWKRGWTVHYEPASVVHHKSGATM